MPVSFNSRRDPQGTSNIFVSGMNSTIKWPTWFVLTGHWLSLVGVALITTAVTSNEIACSSNAKTANRRRWRLST